MDNLQSKTWTKNEVFSIVVRHLLQQKKRAMIYRDGTDDPVMCAYRGRGGLKCAVGILIPDEEYNPIIERKPIDSLHYSASENIGPTLQKIMKDVGIEFLRALQSLHDDGLSDRYTEIENEWFPVFEDIIKDYSKELDPTTVAELTELSTQAINEIVSNREKQNIPNG